MTDREKAIKIIKLMDDFAEQNDLIFEGEYISHLNRLDMRFKNGRFFGYDITESMDRISDIYDFVQYCSNNLISTFKLYPGTQKTILYMPSIKDVIHNVPATIVFWNDNTKTVVKCQEGDVYDPEKGLAMAISKKALGNKGNYCEVFKKWLPEEETSDSQFDLSIDAIRKAIKESNKNIRERFDVSDSSIALLSKKED